jgi:hypothetical protein
MNISALYKIEKGWITLDWSTHLSRVRLTHKNLSELVDKLDNWKSNKKCKEIILIKYKSMPVYVTLKREDFKSMGKWLMIRLTELEMYEECARLQLISNKL